MTIFNKDKETNILLKKDLQQCNSMKQMFEVINKYYYTEATIGIIAKGIILAKIENLISICGLKLRAK